MVNAGRVGIVAKGEWNATTQYTKLDFITYQDKAYIGTVSDIPVGTLPTDTDCFQLCLDLLDYVAKYNAEFAESVSMGRATKDSWLSPYFPITIGKNSIGLGSNVIASGNYSIALGQNVVSLGKGSYAEGLDGIARSDGSHAEGYGSEAVGQYSHAEGTGTIANGNSSHTEGWHSVTTQEASYGHAEGVSTKAEGQFSHAEGSNTTAKGKASHSEGYWTKANGDYSHTSGERTIAGSNHQTVIGKFNIEDKEGKYAFIIGNGESDGVRSNALAIKWDGTIVTSNF